MGSDDSTSTTSARSSSQTQKGNAELTSLIEGAKQIEWDLEHDHSLTMSPHYESNGIAVDKPGDVNLSHTNQVSEHISGSEPLSTADRKEILAITMLFSDYDSQVVNTVKKAVAISSGELGVTLRGYDSDVLQNLCSKRLGAIRYWSYLVYRDKLDDGLAIEKYLKASGVTLGSSSYSLTLSETFAGADNLSATDEAKAADIVGYLRRAAAGYDAIAASGKDNSLIRDDVKNRGLLDKSKNAAKLAVFLQVRTGSAATAMTNIVGSLQSEGLLLNKHAKGYSYNYNYYYGNSEKALFSWAESKHDLNNNQFDIVEQKTMRGWITELEELIAIGAAHQADVVQDESLHFDNGFQQVLAKELEAAEQARQVLQFKLAQSDVVETETLLANKRIVFSNYDEAEHISYPDYAVDSIDVRSAISLLRKLVRQLDVLDPIKIDKTDGLNLGRVHGSISSERDLARQLIDKYTLLAGK